MDALHNYDNAHTEYLVCNGDSGNAELEGVVADILSDLFDTFKIRYSGNWTEERMASFEVAYSLIVSMAIEREVGRSE